MELVLSAEPHQYVYPAKVIIVVSNSLLPLYEKCFTNLEVASHFVRDIIRKGTIFTDVETRFELLVMVPNDDNIYYNPYFSRKVWGTYLLDLDENILRQFMKGLS